MRSKAPVLALAAFLVTGTAALAAPPTFTVRGEITKLDPSARLLVVKETRLPREQRRFEISRDAQVVSGTETESLADLRTGESVLVKYTQLGQKHEARRIEILPEKAPAKS